MMTFPYYFGMGEFAFPSDSVIASAEEAAFEARMAELHGPGSRPCADCGCAVPMCDNEGSVVPVDGAIECGVVSCAACVRARSAG
jgi:hypothetical protein